MIVRIFDIKTLITVFVLHWNELYSLKGYYTLKKLKHTC